MCQMVKNVQEMKKGIAWVLGQLFKQQGGLGSECDENPISILETGMRISFSQSHVRDENENFIFQSRASRRDRESRLRQSSREFSGIPFIACLLNDIFKKKAVNF